MRWWNRIKYGAGPYYLLRHNGRLIQRKPWDNLWRFGDAFRYLKQNKGAEILLQDGRIHFRLH